jgi:hypothetical protein
MTNTRNIKEVIETVKVYKAKQAFLTTPEKQALAGLADDDLVWVLREVTPFGTYSLEVKAVK